MNKLLAGINKFQHEELERYEELFQRLSREGQNPHTLFITCSDSRVLAELITQSKPGDLFVVKNIGNIVPPSAATGSTNSTAAAIEFAVETLRVSDIVICGHSQCGAMTALLGDLPGDNRMPHLKEWLSLAEPVREIIRTQYSHVADQEHRKDLAAGENVLFALENLHSYYCVQDRLMEGSLRLHGWFFEIATAELLAYNPETRQFLPLTREKS